MKRSNRKEKAPDEEKQAKEETTTDESSGYTPPSPIGRDDPVDMYKVKDEDEDEDDEPIDEKPSINTKINVWDIIDLYFKDNLYHKSKHQLDSYNEFIYSKTNGIEYILKRENPLILYKDPLNQDQSKFKYEIQVFFGETLVEEGPNAGTILGNTENIFISSPIIYDKEKKTYMYPNDARLKGLTYTTSIFCNIGVVYRIHEQDKPIVRNFQRISIGSIPIMVHSQLCLLNGLDTVKLTQFGGVLMIKEDTS